MIRTDRKGPPVVTGISPIEGPPGTKVTLRGENLGVDAKDLVCEYRFPTISQFELFNHSLANMQCGVCFIGRMEDNF